MCASTTAMWASLGVRELATKPGARPASDPRLLQQTAPVEICTTRTGQGPPPR